jgi:uncharacterized protein (TIGR02284 family)
MIIRVQSQEAELTSTDTNTKEITSVLNTLTETCKDGENGFKAAAEQAKQQTLKALFAKYSAQRTQYALELQSTVRGLGDKPETTGHMSGALHRGWMGLKEALSSNDDKALIDECEAGEDSAMKAYKEALGKPLPPEIENLVRKQFAGVQEGHRVMSNLKHNRQ